MRGLLAVAGAVSIAAASFLSTASVALAANVLTVTGYTALGQLQWDMAGMMQGGFCSQASGNSCKEVRYVSGSSVLGEPTGLWALRPAIRYAEPPTMVVGFSQGATVASQWLREHDGRFDAPPSDELSFVLLANPLRKYGGSRPAYEGIDEATPDTEYRVLDIAVEYDGAADLPDDLLNPLAVANALAGFTYIHIPGYGDYDLDTAEKIVWVEGNTTYVLIRSENIPLLEPLRRIGLNGLADALNDPLKAIIDSAYDRDYPGLVDPESHDEVLAEFPHATDSALGGAPDAASLRVVDTATDEVVDDTTTDSTVTADPLEVERTSGQPTVEPEPEPVDLGTDTDGAAASPQEDEDDTARRVTDEQDVDEQDLVEQDLDEQDTGESPSEGAGSTDSDDDSDRGSDSSDGSRHGSDSGDVSDTASDSGDASDGDSDSTGGSGSADDSSGE